MKRVWKAAICQVLIVLMAWTPFNVAQAGMIGTDVIVAQQSAQADRAAVAAFLARSDVASQLQSFGVDAASARDRVNALSDEEVHALAQRIDSLPAGAGLHGAGAVLVLVLIVVALWWVMTQR